MSLWLSPVILEGVASNDDVSVPDGQAARGPDRIIVPLDGGQLAERAISVAVALAARASLPITLVTVLSEHDLEENATVYLEARKAELAGMRIDHDVLRGMPVANTLVEFLQRHLGALVCCSTHARLDATKLMLGSVAEELVRRSPVPVVLVGPRVELPAPDSSYEDVVVCVENESSRRLVPYVRDLSTALGLSRSLMQVVGPDYGATTPQGGERRSALLESLSDTFAADGGKAEWELVEDRAVPQAITAFARERSAPLLAFTSRRRYPEERYEPSSITVAVAGIANCPLLVVGPGVSVGPTGHVVTGPDAMESHR